MELSDTSDEVEKVLGYLDLASRADAGQESAIDDFARELLRILGFEEKGTLLRTRFSIPFNISGDITKKAQTDVCLVRTNRIVLLVTQEDKTGVSIKDPEPQVIAEAIATFQYNNMRRRDYLDIDELGTMVVPCITMIGIFPRFYLAPVTKELSNCVITGQYPNNKTIVLRYAPEIDYRRKSDGMSTEDNQKVIIRCYEMFRVLAKKRYSKFLEEF